MRRKRALASAAAPGVRRGAREGRPAARGNKAAHRREAAAAAALIAATAAITEVSGRYISVQEV
jgi:hypothetical protein